MNYFEIWDKPITWALKIIGWLVLAFIKQK